MLHPVAEGPTLRQVGRCVALPTGEASVEWTYFVDDAPVERTYWNTRLYDRRRLRLAIVTN